MRVEILEERLRSNGYQLEQGDTLTVPDDIGRRWCGYGWARDLSGEVPTAERKPGAQKIAPEGAQHR